MKHFLIEIGLAIAFGTLLLFAYFAQSLLFATPTLNKVLAALVFCVFAAYMAIVGDGGPAAKDTDLADDCWYSCRRYHRCAS